MLNTKVMVITIIQNYQLNNNLIKLDHIQKTS